MKKFKTKEADANINYVIRDSDSLKTDVLATSSSNRQTDRQIDSQVDSW